MQCVCVSYQTLLMFIQILYIISCNAYLVNWQPFNSIVEHACQTIYGFICIHNKDWLLKHHVLGGPI